MRDTPTFNPHYTMLSSIDRSPPLVVGRCAICTGSVRLGRDGWMTGLPSSRTAADIEHLAPAKRPREFVELYPVCRNTPCQGSSLLRLGVVAL